MLSKRIFETDFTTALNEELERKMASVRHAVSMGRALRVQNDAKIRQPLAAVYLVMLYGSPSIDR